jgi:hypothetical protein
LSKKAQEAKAFFSIVFKLIGNEILRKRKQVSKASSPIISNPFIKLIVIA